MYRTDPKAIEMLWRTSEEATGVKFDVSKVAFSEAPN